MLQHSVSRQWFLTVIQHSDLKQLGKIMISHSYSTQWFNTAMQRNISPQRFNTAIQYGDSTLWCEAVVQDGGSYRDSAQWLNIIIQIEVPFMLLGCFAGIILLLRKNVAWCPQNLPSPGSLQIENLLAWRCPKRYFCLEKANFSANIVHTLFDFGIPGGASWLVLQYVCDGGFIWQILDILQ